MKKELVHVTEEEGLEIKRIYNRLSSLKELAGLISSNDKPTYSRYILDLENTDKEYQSWWSNICSKYSLPESADGKWEFNFRNNKIYLI